ncbi:hypothetical protein Gpo141_00014788 [Globisporangium polare]
MATTSPNAPIPPSIPTLTPVSLVPKRPSRAAAPLAFLDTIDAVEINRTIERDGVTYFVLDVYLKHYTSRIPTVQMREKQQHQHQFHQEHSQPLDADEASTQYRMDEPDYQLEKRFSDFADLRYHVWVHAQKQSECQCAYSREFMAFIVHSYAQPRLLVRLAATTGMRKKLFTTFCNEFLRLAVHGGGGRRREVHSDCDVLLSIPTLMERFFRKQDGSR